MATRRVLHVVGAMNRGGAETMLMNLYRVVDRQDVQFDFLELASDSASDYAEEIAELGGRVFNVDWSQTLSGSLGTARRLGHIMRQKGPYLAVHSHVLFASALVLTAARLAGVKTRVAHSHNTSDIGSGVVTGVYRRLSRAVLRLLATEVAACSQDAGFYLFGRRFRDVGVVVPNAVDTCRFHPTDGPKVDMHVGPGSAQRRVFVSIARLEPVKNHLFLLDLAAELEAQGFPFLMFFVGQGTLHGILDAAIVERGLQHRVALLGLRSDTDAILRGSDALVMPSLFEGLPVALVEAQACGVPCLVSDQVDREADLGLGLVDFISVGDLDAWVAAASAALPARASADRIVSALKERGYDVRAALAVLMSLYPPG